MKRNRWYRLGAAGALALALGTALLAACTAPTAGSPAARWQVEPAQLSAESRVGAPPPALSFTLRNDGRAAAAFDVSASAGWIHAEPNSGQLDPGGALTVHVALDPCTSEGTRSGSLTVSGGGDEATVALTQTCLAANGVPQAQLSAQPTSGTAPLAVHFEVASSDPDGDALTCSLDFGDGSAPLDLCAGSVDHTYDAAGNYTAVLRVSDGEDEARAEVAVSVGAPGAVNWAVSPSRITFAGTVGGPAPEPQSALVRNAGEAAGDFTITSSADWLSVTPASGTLEPGQTRSLTVSSRACERAGTETAALTIAGGGSEARIEVERSCSEDTNNRPVARLSADPLEGLAPLTVTFQASASDPDGDALTCSLDFGDGASMDTACEASVEHTYTERGDYLVVFTALDSRGSVDQASVTVAVTTPNEPPTASLSASPTSGEAPLSVTFERTSSDPDGDALTCTLDFGDGSQTDGCSGNVSHTYREAGRFEAVFTVRDGEGETATATAVVEVSEPATGETYEISFLFVEEPDDEEVRAAFDRAAARWQEVIIQGLSDVDVEIAAGTCLEGDPGYQGTVDDLVIVVDLAAIDGEGGTLGMAGPCYVRGDTNAPDYYLPFYGVLQLDADDVAWMQDEGVLDVVVLHEIGHILGIGVLWEAGPFDFLSYDASDCQSADEIGYVGAGALDAWHALGGEGDVPVENEGGSGTKCGHWQEDTFGTELMTGWINGADAPLSEVTVGTLEDLGYRVDYGAADNFALTAGVAPLSKGRELEEILIYPRLP